MEEWDKILYGSHTHVLGNLLEGELKTNKMKLLQAWIEIHQEELMADWELANQGETIFKIEPLK
jgi:Domain of unknown function (DUF4160)